jgi:hypothetical protein
VNNMHGFDLAFFDELEKIADVKSFLAKNLWHSGMGRTMAGAALGAGAGALTAPPELRQQRAIQGAMIGGAGGLMAPLATKAGRTAAAERAKNFGAAQLHGLTGMGKAPVHKVDGVVQNIPEHLTNIPGMAMGLATSPMQTLADSWKHTPGLMKAVTGLSAIPEAKHIFDKNSEEGLGEKILGAAGRTGGMVLTSSLPMLPMLAAGTAIGSASAAAGRGVDRLFGRKKPKITEETTQAPPPIPRAIQLGTQVLRDVNYPRLAPAGTAQ